MEFKLINVILYNIYQLKKWSERKGVLYERKFIFDKLKVCPLRWTTYSLALVCLVFVHAGWRRQSTQTRLFFTNDNFRETPLNVACQTNIPCNVINLGLTMHDDFKTFRLYWRPSTSLVQIIRNADFLRYCCFGLLSVNELPV